MKESFARAAKAAVLSMPVFLGIGAVLSGQSNKAQAQTVSITSGDLLDVNARTQMRHFSTDRGYSRVNINACTVRGGVELSSGADDRVEFYLRTSAQICSVNIQPDHQANTRLVESYIPRNLPNISGLISNELRKATGLSQRATDALTRGSLSMANLTPSDQNRLAGVVVNAAASAGQTLTTQNVLNAFRLIPAQQTVTLNDLSTLAFTAQTAVTSSGLNNNVRLAPYTQQAATQLGAIGTETQRLNNILHAAERIDTRALVVENVASSLQGVSANRQGFAEIEMAGGVRVMIARSGNTRAYIEAEGGVSGQVWNGVPGVASVCLRPHLAGAIGLQTRLMDGMLLKITGGVQSNLPCVGATDNSVLYAERLYRGTLRIGISQTFGGATHAPMAQNERARDPSLRIGLFTGMATPASPAQSIGQNGFWVERRQPGYEGGVRIEREIPVGRDSDSRTSATYGVTLSGGTFTGQTTTNQAQTRELVGRLNTEAVTDRVAEQLGMSRAELNRLGASSTTVTQALSRYQAGVLSASRRNTVQGYQGAMMLTGSLRRSFDAAGDPTVYAFGGVGVQARYTQTDGGTRMGIAPQAMVGVGADVGVGRISEHTTMRVFAEAGSLITGPEMSTGVGGVAYGHGMRVSHMARIGITLRGL